MKTYNTAPYFDDFDASKNFHRILFKPGFAVQARELTQLQTILQNQISKFGDHIFKDGSIVLDGRINLVNVNWILVNSALTMVQEGSIIEGVESGAKGRVALVERVDVAVYKIYYNQISTTDFIQSESIISDLITYAIADVTDFAGQAKMFTIGESIFYVNGAFVFCNDQKLILKENASFNSKVGLVIKEYIATSDDDSTLLDPAQGSYNYAAPGGDRYAISLTLTSFNYDPQNEATIDNFIELARLSNGEIVSQVTNASYSDLETNLARRTYDESGDYTVRAFGLKVVPHIYGNANKLSLAISPGKAYIKGYEFETISTTHIDLDKARDQVVTQDNIFQVNYGSYIFIENPSGPIDYSTNPAISIKSVDGVVIGTANISSIERTFSNQYKLYLFNVSMTESFSSALTVETATWSASVDTEAYGASNASIITPSSTVGIVRLPHTFVSTLLINGQSATEYTGTKAFNTTISDVAESGDPIFQGIIATSGANQYFVRSNTDDFIAVDSSGNVLPITNISGNSTSKVLTFGITEPASSVKIYTQIAYKNAVHKTKTLQTTTATFALTKDKISLNTSDCVALTNVVARSTFNTTITPQVVTDQFNFNNGQKDDFYDHGWIQAKETNTISASYDVIDVTFTYFAHPSSEGFFSVDSYSTYDYSLIPTYVSSKGEVYRLSDCLDFRPVRANGQGSTSILGQPKVSQDDIISASYSYYLSRIDKLVLSKERKLSIVKGIPAVDPIKPEDLSDSMTLYAINIPAYTTNATDVTFEYVDNRRYTMRDIGRLDRRINRLEYYTALSFLEKQAKDEVIPSDTPGIDRFKNGILVDSFAGHAVGSVNNPDYACSIDKENQILRPKFSSFSVNYVPSILTNAKQENDLITLPYTTEKYIEQPFATSWVNLNPYMVFEWNGRVSLDPATDNWIDTRVKPDVTVNINGENDVYSIIDNNTAGKNSTGVIWDDWRTVVKGTTTGIQDSYSSTSSSNKVDNTIINTSTTTNTQSITTTDVKIKTGIDILKSDTKVITKDFGSKVVDVSIVPYVRPRLITFNAQHLKPSTVLYASFDGVDVSDYCAMAPELKITGTTFDKTKATQVKNAAGTKKADILLAKSGSLFIRMDGVSTEDFAVNESILVLIDNVWQNAGTVTSVVRRNDVRSNENGDCVGFFSIPDPVATNVKFRTGELVFRLSDSLSDNATTAAEVKYVAQGLSQSTERTLVSTRVATVSIKPVTNIANSTSTASKSVVVSQSTATVQLPPPPPPITLQCNSTQYNNGAKGTFVYSIDFANDVGEVGIEINPSNDIPVRYTLTWDGKEYTTGFVGNTSYNQQLNAAGYPTVKTNSIGKLVFNKTAATPSACKLTIDSPIEGSNWGIKVACVPIPAPMPVYSIQELVSSVNEGDSVSFIVNTSHVDVGTTLQWRLLSDSSATATNFTDSATSGTITVTSTGIATLTRQTANIPQQTGNKTFKIELLRSGTVVATSGSITIIDTVVDVTPRYSVNVTPTNVSEGNIVTITVTTENVSAGTSLTWSLTSNSTLTAADFNDGVGSGTFNVTSNGIYVFSKVIKSDTIVESPEVFAIDIKNSGVIVATSSQVTVTSVDVPTYAFDSHSQLINEGSLAKFVVRTTGVATGTTLYWTLSNDSTANASNFTDGATNGTITVTSSGEMIISRQTNNITSVNGDKVFKVELRTGSINGTVVATSGLVTIRDITVPDVTPKYTIEVTPTRVSESDVVTVTVTTQNVSAGTALTWSLTSNSTLTAADFNDGIGSGTFSVPASGIYVFSKIIKVDGLVEPLETFAIDIKYNGTIVATSTQVTVSSPDVPTYVFDNHSQIINEGDTILFPIKTNGVPSGTSLQWRLSSDSTANASNFTDGAITGTVTTDALGGAYLTRKTANINTINGDKTFKIQLLNSGTVVATSGLVTIKDVTIPDTTPRYTIEASPSNVTEGNFITVVVSTQNVAAGTSLTWSLTSNSTVTAADFTDGVSSGTFTIPASGVYVFTKDLKPDTVVENPEVFAIDIKKDGVVVATSQQITVTSLDVATYTFDNHKQQVSEGGNVVFTLRTVSVPTGTVLQWRLKSDSTATAGNFTDGLITGNITVVDSGIMTFNRVTSNIASLDGNKTFTIEILNAGVVVATSGLVTIIDVAPLEPIYTVTAASSQINEGDAAVFTFNAMNTTAPSTLYWTLATGSTATSADLVATQGTFTVTNNVGTFTVSSLADYLQEGNETFAVVVRKDSYAGTVLAQSTMVTIRDVFAISTAHQISANVTKFDQTIPEGGVAWNPHVGVMAESKALAPFKISWSGTRGATKLGPDVKYRVKSLTVSDPRFKIFKTPRSELFAHRVRADITSVTPIANEVHLHENPNMVLLDQWGTKVDWVWIHWSAPLRLVSESFVGTIATSEQQITVYPVFNPNAVDGSVMFSPAGDVAIHNGYQYKGAERYPAPQFPLTVTVEWEYVSGDDTIAQEKRTITSQTTGIVKIGGSTQVDPVAQTFFVSAQDYPNGIFVKSIDLYFRTKSTWAPVEVQLRPVINGFPSGTTILPFGISIKEYVDINTSSDATAATTFEFGNVIHLAPGEYAFVIVTNTNEYTMFTSVIGDFMITDPEKRVTTQPMLGSLFKSQNSSTWTPIQEEDIKFALNKCSFDTATEATIVYNVDTSEIQGNIEYETFFAGGEVIDFSDTNINYFYKTNLDSDFIQYQSGMNIPLSSTRTVKSDDPTSLQLKTVLSSLDANITPVIDNNRLSSVLVKNIINNDSSNEKLAFGGNSVAKYITRSVKLAPGFDSADLKVFFSAKIPSGCAVKVYYKIAAASDTFFDDNEYKEMELDYRSSYIENKYSEYRYKTIGETAFEDGSKFDTFAVKLVMLSDNSAKVPLIKDLRVIALDD